MNIIKRHWSDFKSTKHYHNVMMFLVFVAISAVFWLIMKMNDNAQDDFEVRLVIDNTPKGVTFLSDVPEFIHVNVRDKGSSLFSNGILRRPEMHVKFEQFASDGVFRLSPADISAGMRSIFGGAAVISVSVDSLRLYYTTVPGKQVPLVINVDVTPAFQCAINAKPYATSGNTVTVYAMPGQLDTINAVYTQHIVCHDLAESKLVKVNVRPIKGARIVPSQVDIQIPVEPLVLKRAIVDVKPVNVPAGQSIMLFPSKIEVTYFAPMSQFEKPSEDIEVIADYAEVMENPSASHISLQLDSYPEKYINTKLVSDSVEYTIVKKQ